MADAIEARLVALGEALELPRLDSLVDDVLADLDDVRPAAHRRRPLLVAAAVLIVAATVALAVPDSRRTIAGWFGFDGLRVERVEVVPPTVTAPVASTPPVADAAAQVAAAAEQVGVAPLVAPALGDPIAVETPLDGYLAVRYAEASVVVLPGLVEPELFTKFVGGGVDIRTVEVAGAPGYWVTGAPHVFMYVDEAGAVREARPAADSLVWQRGADIVRVEGDVPLDRAIEIAASVRPP